MVTRFSSTTPPKTLHNHKQVTEAWERISFVHQMYYDETAIKQAFLLYGDSGLGKSCIFETYRSQFVGIKTEETQTIPVFYYSFRHQTTSTNEVLKLLITALGAPLPRGRVNAAELEQQFVALLRIKQVELIIFDEIQNLISTYDGVKFQGIIKYFCWMIDSAQIKCSIVFGGSEAAHRIINFGQVKGKKSKTFQDVEHFSRRHIRPLKLTPLLPVSRSWIDCVNWFVEQIGHPKFSIVEDSSLLDRLYIAYEDRAMSSLRDLFLRSNCRNAKTKAELVSCLKHNFDMFCKGELNPFDTRLFTDKQAYDYNKQASKTLKLDLSMNQTKAISKYEVV